jgi:hypothetical protein
VDAETITQDQQPTAVDEQRPVTEQAEAEQKPETGEQPQAEEAEDADKLPAWAKKKLRNAERRIGTLTKRLGGYEERVSHLQREPIDGTNQPEQDDSERLSLSRQELAELVRQEAQKHSKEESVVEHRRRVAEGLVKNLGAQRFEALSHDLDAALGGIEIRKGEWKPAAEAIFEADDVKAVVEYLADPDNEAEASALSRMSGIQAGKAIAKLEAKLEAKKAADKGKPQPSKAAEPLEVGRGRGTVTAAPNPSDVKAWIKFQNEREAKGLYRN